MKKAFITLTTAMVLLSGGNAANADTYQSTLTDDFTGIVHGNAFADGPSLGVLNYPVDIKPVWWNDNWMEGGYYGALQVSYLKFVVPDIYNPKETIQSSTLSAYVFGSGNSTINAYVINYDAWDEYNTFPLTTHPFDPNMTSVQDEANNLHFDPINDFYVTGQTSYVNEALTKYEWTFDFSALTESQIDYLINAGSDDYITIALFGEQNPFTDEDILSKDYVNYSVVYDDEPVDSEDNLLWQQYVVGTNGAYAPQLVIETAPVPEPTSMLLGLLGLGGAMGLRRNRK